MKLLFRILLLQRSKDQGFTLPMVIGIGLIMVLLSSISLLQASEENLTAISKTQSSTSLAMAELGVSRYRELLNNNRVLAVHNLDNWTNPEDVANQTCNTITAGTGDDGWANTNDWRPVALNETTSVPPTDFNNDGDAADANVVIGSYRIVDYIYQNDVNPDHPTNGDNGVFGQVSDEANRTDPDDPDTGPRGILTVQGRVPDSNSVAQIEVTIPIGVNLNDLNAMNPGIWIHESSVENLGTINKVDSSLTTNNLGNLVLYRADNGDDMCTDVSGPEDIRDPRDLPPLITTLPATVTVNDLDSNITDDDGFSVPDGELILGKLSGLSKADPNTDSDGVARYYYQVTGGGSLNIDNDESLLSDGKARVVIVVDGDLNIDGTGGEIFVGNSSDQPLAVTPFYAESHYLEIHVDGNVNFTGTGTFYINGLIRSSGVVNINGNPTVNLKGSIWANDWNMTGGIVNLIRDVGDEDHKYYSITPNRTPKPLTFAPTGWEQQEATN